MDFLALAGRVILSLAVVLVLLWLASRGMRRNQRRSSRGMDVDVLARQPLARNASVAVVKVGDRALVLGVTESRIDLLADQPLESLTLPATDAQPLGDTTGEVAVPTVSTVPTVPPVPVSTVSSRTMAPQRPGTTAARGPLAGSALSPATWGKALDAVRELTVRK